MGVSTQQMQAALALVDRGLELRHRGDIGEERDSYAADPLRWLAERCIVRRQDTEALVPFSMQPWHSQVFMALTGNDVVLKSRDVGSSTFFVAVRLHDVLFRPPGDVLVAADRGDNAKNLVSYARTILENLPPGERPRLTRDNTQELEFKAQDIHGNYLTSSIKAITATAHSGRSERCRHLICTEMGFWENDVRYWAALTGAVAAGGTTVCESTWPEKGAFTLYSRLWSDPARGFKRHFIGRRAVDWHDAAWEADRRMKLTNADMSREYPEQESDAIEAPSEGVFKVFKREALRCAHEIVDDETLLHLRVPVCFGGPEDGRTYVTAWDLGRSKERGAVVGITLDVTDAVHFIRVVQRYEELPWPLTQSYIEQTHRAFHGETFVESNGPGDPVIGNLNVPVTPFWTSMQSKTYMIKHTVMQMEQGFLKWDHTETGCPVGQLDVELQLYDWRDARLVQDCVMALCIAEYSSLLGAVAFRA